MRKMILSKNLKKAFKFDSFRGARGPIASLGSLGVCSKRFCSKFLRLFDLHVCIRTGKKVVFNLR